MTYAPIFATRDSLPDYHKYMTFLKKVYRHEFRTNGFRRISTPLFEDQKLVDASGFCYKPIIENTDFEIRQNAALGVMRAYLDNKLHEKIQPFYFYYIDRFYRKLEDSFECMDLIGSEIIGENDPILDAIQIYINYSVLKKIGIGDKCIISINSSGVAKEKEKYKEELITFYESKKNILTEKSKKLIHTDPMQILKSEDEDEKILNKNAPKMVPKFLKKDSKKLYNALKEYLEVLKVPYIEDHTLVGDNEVQTRTLWQISYEDGEVLGKGFRHDSLAQNLGEKKEIPSVGFYINANKLIALLEKNNIALKNKDQIDLFFVQLGDDAKKVVLPISIQAREAGINTVVSLGTPSMKEQMIKAQKSGAKYVVMVGVMEAKNGVFQVRNQEDGTQEEVKKEDLVTYITEKLGEKNLNFYSPARDLVMQKDS